MKWLTKFLALLVVLIVLGVADEEECKKHEECPNKQYCCYSESKNKQYCSTCFGACRKDSQCKGQDECCFGGGKIGTCQPHLPGEKFCKPDPWRSTTPSSQGQRTTPSGDQSTKLTTQVPEVTTKPTTQVPEVTTKSTTQVPEETTKRETKKPVTIPKPKPTTQVQDETTMIPVTVPDETTRLTTQVPEKTTLIPVTIPEPKPTEPGSGSGGRKKRCFINKHCTIVGLAQNECRFDNDDSAWGYCFKSDLPLPEPKPTESGSGTGGKKKRCFINKHCTIVGLAGNECKFDNADSAWGYCSKKN